MRGCKSYECKIFDRIGLHVTPLSWYQPSKLINHVDNFDFYVLNYGGGNKRNDIFAYDIELEIIIYN